MPVAQIFALPNHDGTDGAGPRGPFTAAMIPWIALSVALTAIACVWLGRASVPFMLALAAWAGIALARQRTDVPARTVPTAPPAAPHIRLCTPSRPTGFRPATPETQRPAPVLRVVGRTEVV